MISVSFIVFVCLLTNVISAPVNHLDVFIARKELKRFFHEFKIGDFYIIQEGVVSTFVKSQFIDSYLPPIAPAVHSLELRLKSTHKLYYKLYLSSNDKGMMKTPTSNIKPSGQVPRKAKPFKIRFPCNRRKSGEATLTIKMEFMAPSRKTAVLTQFVLKLKRKCEKAKEIANVMRPVPTARVNHICEKKCDKERVMRRFCISDFAVRARVEKRSINTDGTVRYRVRVTKYYKTGRVAIPKKQYIEIQGKDITCKCGSLQIKKTYLILGKENKRTESLFLDDYTFAIDWSNGGKKLAKLHKKKASCPKRIFIIWHS